MFKPVRDGVAVLKVHAPEKTASGLFIPEDDRTPQTSGEVIGIGHGVKEVNEGNLIIFRPELYDEVEHEGVEYLIVKEEDVLAIVG